MIVCIFNCKDELTNRSNSLLVAGSEDDGAGDSRLANVRGSLAGLEMLLSDRGLALEGGSVLEGVVAVEGEELRVAAGEALQLAF